MVLEALVVISKGFVKSGQAGVMSNSIACLCSSKAELGVKFNVITGRGATI